MQIVTHILMFHFFFLPIQSECQFELRKFTRKNANILTPFSTLRDTSTKLGSNTLFQITFEMVQEQG